LGVAIYCFVVCHQPCPFKTDDECAIEFYLANAARWVGLLLISAGNFVSVFYWVANGYISRLFIVAEGIALYFMLIHVNHNLNYRDISGILQLIEFIFLAIAGCIYAMWRLARYICTRKHPMRYVAGLMIPLIIALLLLRSKLYSSCNTWPQGINGVSIDQSGEYCHVKEPEICWYSLLEGLQDTSKASDCTIEPFHIDP
jgi:hypothetical protein